MLFAIPSAFFWLALAVPVILLYIMKVRLRRLPVSTNMFWKQVYEEKPPRALSQKLRHWMSLLLQLLLLALIVLALSDPFFSRQSRTARRIVLVIDNSGSMAASDVSPSRLGAARKKALETVEGLGMLDQAAIVVAGQNPSVICGMTGHLPTLKTAIESIPQSDSSTSLNEAIELARDLIGSPADTSKASKSNEAILLLTDGCLSESDVSFLNQIDGSNQTGPVLIRTVFGSSANNIGITQFESRRSLTDPTGYHVLVSVFNASDWPAQCRLELRLNDGVIDVFTLKLAAGETWSQTLEKVSLAGGTLKAELSRIEKRVSGDAEKIEEYQPLADGWLSDNVGYSILPDRPTHKVLLITQGNVFLQKALEATPLVELTVGSLIPDPIPAEFLSKDAVIVLHGQVPSNLPSGNLLVIDPVNDCDLWKLQGYADNVLITEQVTASPLLSFVNFQNVSLPRARQFQLPDNAKPLVKSISGEVLYAELPRPTGRCLLLSANLDESDLAFRTAFPILISNALTSFSGGSSDIQFSLSPEDVTTINVPEALAQDVIANPGTELTCTLIGPDQRSLKATVSPVFIQGDGDSGLSSGLPALTIGPFPAAGLWTAVITANTTSDQQPIAVNISNPRETDLRPQPSMTKTSNVAADSMSFSRPIWMSLILLACVLTSVEWILYHRRVIE